MMRQGTIRASALALGALLAAPLALAQAPTTEIELLEGNVVISEQDGTQITMAPGSEVALGEDEDGITIITLNTGNVFLSNVLHTSGAPIRVRMGDEIIEISRASVMVSRDADNMDVTLLHGQRVAFSAGGALTQAGTRMRMGGGGSQIDRPSAAGMAAMKGALGAVAAPPAGPGPRQAGPAGRSGLPPQPQTQVPGQIQLQDRVRSVVDAMIPPMAQMPGGGMPGDMGGMPGDMGGMPGDMGGMPGDMGGMPGDMGSGAPKDPDDLPFGPLIPGFGGS